MSVWASMPLLALLPALTPQPNPAATRSPPPPLPPECDAVTYAIHKPRGVLSAARDSDPTRRCLTDVMVDAGVAPVAGHVGRLDLDTSGLILVTADGLLLEAALNIPRGEVAASESTAPLTKTYQLLLQGRHEAGSAAVLSLGEPLTHRRGGREFHSDAAASVSVLRCFQSPELATEYALIDRRERARIYTGLTCRLGRRDAGQLGVLRRMPSELLHEPTSIAVSAAAEQLRQARIHRRIHGHCYTGKKCCILN